MPNPCFLVISVVLFFLLTQGFAETRLPPNWFSDPLDTMTMDAVPDERLVTLLTCPHCQSLELRQNRYTLDGNFYSSAPFEVVVEFFHHWMLHDTYFNQVYMQNADHYMGSYLRQDNNQQVTLAVEQVNKFYRFEVDGLARNADPVTNW